MTHNQIDRNRDQLKTIVSDIYDAVEKLEEWSADNDDEFEKHIETINDALGDINEEANK